MAKKKKANTNSAANQRAYRERLKAADLEGTLKKERDRWHKRRILKKVNAIEDLPERGKRILRSKWRKKKAEYRKSKSQQQPANDTAALASLSSTTNTPFLERKKRG